MDRRESADLDRHIVGDYDQPEETLSPDCVYNKHAACRGDAWDAVADAVTDCTCECHPAGHQRLTGATNPTVAAVVHQFGTPKPLDAGKSFTSSTIETAAERPQST